MARSTYYYHEARLDNNDGYDDLRKRICSIYYEHHGRYGYRRITMELRNEGITVNHKTVLKLMKRMDLKARMKTRHYRSYRGEVGRIAPNIINRDFSAPAPDRKWATDITEVKINEKKLYLSPVLDMFNGEIISYTISYHPDLKMVTSMLDKAFRKHKDISGLIIHSDQGWHYQNIRYQMMLKDRGIIQSMSRKGNCLDNSMMEKFFGIMKNELLYTQTWNSVEQFAMELVRYIKYYNNKRIKLRLNGKSPVQYRASFQSYDAY